MVKTFRGTVQVGFSICVAFLVLFLGSVGVSADSTTPAVGYDNPRVQTTLQAVNLLDPYVVRLVDGTLALRAPASVTSRVGVDMLAKLRSGLRVVNQEIKAGHLATTSDHRVYDPKATSLSVQAGWTGVRWQWYGVQIYLNELATQKFEGLVAIGAGAAAICAAIPAIANQVVCAILAALGGILIGVIMWVDNGNGVVITHTWWNDNYIWAQ